MATEINLWDSYELRIKKILSRTKIRSEDIIELFEIMHIYNAVPKLIPEELSEWCNNTSIQLRGNSRSLRLKKMHLRL